MKDNRTLFDLGDEEFGELGDEEKYEIFQNTNEMIDDIMFPDGRNNK